MFLQKNNPKAPPLEFGAISKEDLLNMCANSVAYIRKDADNHIRIYAANGTLINEEDSVSDAQHEIRSKNMMCATLH